MMKIKIVRRAGTLLPEYKTAGAACMDLEASIQTTVEIMPWETLIIGTGIFVEIPEGWCIEVVARSSLHKRGLIQPNGVGIIDSDYRGEIKLILTNISDSPVFIYPGERLAQMMLRKVERIEWDVVGVLSNTARGDGGFGSTGD
jgi:dUTP pyrophosphatase